MSSLTIRPKPWAAYPDQTTTLAQLAVALTEFDLEIQVDQDLEVLLVQSYGTEQEPPSAEELAQALYGAEADYLIEDSGIHRAVDLADLEARDRHFEDDQDLV